MSQDGLLAPAGSEGAHSFFARSLWGNVQEWHALEATPALDSSLAASHRYSSCPSLVSGKARRRRPMHVTYVSTEFTNWIIFTP